MPVHPRFHQRLEDTLARRLAEFEEKRLKARETILTVLRLVIRLDGTLGTPGSPREIECLSALREIDGLRNPRLSSQADLEDLSLRISRIGDDVGSLLGSLPQPADTGASGAAPTVHRRPQG